MEKLGILLCLLLSSQIWAGDWQRVKNGIPVSAYKMGRDTNGKVLYACQVSFRNSLQIGKTWQGSKYCNVPYAGTEHLLIGYKVLRQKPRLKFGPKLNRYAKPFVAGTDTNGEALYICKTRYNNSVQIGKTWAGYSKCNIAYGGKEVLLPHYAVLKEEGRRNYHHYEHHTHYTKHKRKRGEGYQCIRNFTTEICGYNCMNSGNNAACAPKRGMQCMADNFNNIQCGYHCIASPFKVACSQHRNDTCVKNVFNEVRCGKNCRIDNFNHIQCDD